ncbi:MAG: hypothetical protein K5765_01260 [Clostridia bacterium]|nr:hypothetical protein [Clostridia bacterium]
MSKINNKSKTKVVAYRLDGSLFRIYDSARSACRTRHAHPRTIDKCIRGDSLTAFNYMWRRYPANEIPEQIPPLVIKKNDRKNIPIAKLSGSGEIIEIYSSIKKASETNKTDPHSIRDVLNHKYQFAKGIKYRYLEDNELEQYYKNAKKN